MSFRSSLLLLGSLLGLTQCQAPAIEPLDKMPEATQTGAGTAGARVDGQLWVARYDGTIGVPSSPAATASWRKASNETHPLALLFVKVTDEDADNPQNHTTMKLYVPDILRPGTFVFDQVATPNFGLNPTAYAGFNYGRRSPYRDFFTGPQHTGRLVITRLDTVYRVVSRTFEFTASEFTSTITGFTPVPGGRITRVTEGRFDATF